jgi:hypothetical protein
MMPDESGTLQPAYVQPAPGLNRMAGTAAVPGEIAAQYQDVLQEGQRLGMPMPVLADLKGYFDPAQAN